MEQIQNSPKDIVAYMCRINDTTPKNWGLQIKNAKLLLEKYSWTEIKYALDYYKSIGVAMYSLGFLLTHDSMAPALSMYKTEMNAMSSEGSGKRNRNRIRQNSET